MLRCDLYKKKVKKRGFCLAILQNNYIFAISFMK